VPACPPLDDPTLPKPEDDKSKVTADSLQAAKV
jgi:hypothetical protein